MVKWLASWSGHEDKCRFGIDIHVTREGNYLPVVIIISWLEYEHITTIW